MPVKIELDVTKLSREEKLCVLKEILLSEESLKEDILKFDDSIQTLPDDVVENMVMEDFEKYREVFKALA